MIVITKTLLSCCIPGARSYLQTCRRRVQHSLLPVDEEGNNKIDCVDEMPWGNESESVPLKARREWYVV